MWTVLEWAAHWIIGWGGIGALVSALAWVAWFFCPPVPGKQVLLHIAVVATVITVAATYFFTKGYSDGVTVTTEQWDAANERAKIAAKARDEAIAAITAERVRLDTQDLQKQAEDLQKQVDDYAKQLAGSKNGACILTDDDIKRLRKF